VKHEHINRGAADRPLSSDDITEKFMDNATTAVSKAQAIKLREAVLTLESAGDLKAVEALFACGKEFS
jgi:uncharacterized protein YbbK (DUF523 family)